MDTLDHWLRQAADLLSLMLAPWIALMQRSAALLHQRMDAWAIPYEWQTPLLTAAMLAEVALVLRFLGGWLRMIVLTLTALTVIKVYDLV